MKHLLTIIVLACLAIGVANAQETYSFRTNRPQGVSIESSTSAGMSLHYSIQELGIANIDNGEVKGQEIILKGQFGLNAEGHPNLPVVNRYIAVPQGATVSMHFRENASTTLNDIDLLPAMPARTDFAEGLPQLRWDAAIFGHDAVFPTENIVVSSPLQIRGLDVVILSITPFRYNPVRRTLEVLYDIDVDISFDGGNGQFGESRYLNPDWKHILQNLVINGEMLSNIDYYDYIRSVNDRDLVGCEYLIIAPDNTSALAWADTLKAFRTKQGISTKVVSVTECGGNNAQSIRNYIVNAYNTWAIPPAAVLLFGGWYNNTGIRPFYHNTVAGDYASQRYATDFPYSDMNGDSIADVALSRITARNAEEYQTFVEKTIAYETNPPTSEIFYDRPLISSGHEGNKWFLISSQSIDGFFRKKIGKHPTDLYMVNSGSIPTTEWSTGYNATVLMDYFGPNGQDYIPEDVSELHDWRSKNDSVPLHNALNEGTFLTMYRDHSNYNAWWCPAFKSLSMDNLVNNPLTFVLSISCSCTIFTNAGRCLIDAFCIKEGGGAVGGIGAGALTHSYFNDILAWGIYDCIWPSFLPDMGGNTPPAFVRPAYVLSEAKNYFDYHFFLPNWWPDVVQSSKHIFSYTGETYLNLFTEVPQPIQITHGQYIAAGARTFSVTAEEGAVICLSRNGQIIDVAQSEGQSCTFVMPFMEAGDRFIVTATKQNHLRYEDVVTVVPNNCPYVVVERNGILAENEFNTLYYGEHAHVGIMLHNYGNHAAENIVLSLSCSSPYIEITQNTCQYHNLASQQTVTINDAFRFNIDKHIPDLADVTFSILVNDGSGFRQCRIQPPIAAPSLVVRPNLTFSNDNGGTMLQLADDGNTDLHVKVANNGHFDSGTFNMQLEIQAPFITVETPSRILNPLAKGRTIEQVFRVSPNGNIIDDGWLKTRITLDDGFHQTIMDTLLPFGGFNETFDFGNLSTHNWQMSGSAPWITTDVEPYSGGYCAQSGSITHNQQSDLSITLPVKDTEISFFKKVSSEHNYDKLHFFIGEKDMGEWSGTKPWSEERYPIEAGTVTLTWAYIKDYSVNMGSDCAWIDNINIEPTFTPIFHSGGVLKSCIDDNIVIDCSYAYHYENLEWVTAGDGVFDDSHSLHPTYLPGPQDRANGGTTLTLNVDGENSPLQLLLVNEISMGNAIVGDDLIDSEETIFSHYSVEGQQGISYHWQLDPAEAGSLFVNNNEVDVVWDYSIDLSEATLSVFSNTSCGQPLSKTIQFNILSLEEQLPSSFTLYPNPTDGKTNLVLDKFLRSKAVIEVYNLLGECVMKKNLSGLKQGETIELNLDNLVSGLYIIKLSTKEGNCSRKVSVK